MIDYNQFDVSTYTCFICKKRFNLKKSHMVCENFRHFCHKTCMKKIYKNKYEQILTKGYIYNSGKSSNYKNHICNCGCKMELNNSLKKKAKKVFQSIAPFTIILLLI